MMTMFTMILICIMIMISMKSMNPMKMSMMLMLSSSVLFWMLTEKMGETWFPLMFFLIFMGGILIMFMIISSIMPNQKSKKVKFFLMGILTPVIVTSMLMHSSEKSNEMMNQTKWFMESSMNLKMMITVMILYFLSYIIILSKEKTTLRTYLC